MKRFPLIKKEQLTTIIGGCTPEEPVPDTDSSADDSLKDRITKFLYDFTHVH
jgi:hypothetical protein